MDADALARGARDGESAAERFEPLAHAGQTVSLDDFAAMAIVMRRDRERAVADCRISIESRSLAHGATYS